MSKCRHCRWRDALATAEYGLDGRCSVLAGDGRRTLLPRPEERRLAHAHHAISNLFRLKGRLRELHKLGSHPYCMP